MHLEQLTNLDLWNQSATLLSSIQYLDSSANARYSSISEQIKGVIQTIYIDVVEACTGEDQNIILYHFSKAKSSCLVLNEMLLCNEVYTEKELNGFFIRKNNEIISTLNNYIHLCRINIILELRKKKK